jgi:hypothetical protein
MPPSGYVQSRPLDEAGFRQRCQILRGAEKFDGSVDQARKLYAILGCDLGSDELTPNWERAVLDRRDLQSLEGYGLAPKSMPQKNYAADKRRIDQRFEMLSKEGDSLRVTVLYAQSPRQAQIQLLEWFANTSFGLGQHLWGLTAIKNGPGDVCLMSLLIRFDPKRGFLQRPTDVRLSDSRVVFFGGAAAVLVVNQGREDDDRDAKERRSAMGLAGRLDEMLTLKLRKAGMTD